jgi:hypothetical protein
MDNLHGKNVSCAKFIDDIALHNVRQQQFGSLLLVAVSVFRGDSSPFASFFFAL